MIAHVVTFGFSGSSGTGLIPTLGFSIPEVTSSGYYYHFFILSRRG